MGESERCIFKRLEEVWAWKDAIYDEVAHLPIEEALAAVMKQAHIASEKYHFQKYNKKI